MDVFINNGTIKISSLEKEDAGHYDVEIFSDDGRLLRHISLKLDVHGKYYKHTEHFQV